MRMWTVDPEGKGSGMNREIGINVYSLLILCMQQMGFPGGSAVKNPPISVASSLVSYFRSHMFFAFLFLTYSTQYDHLQAHPCCCEGHYLILFFFFSIYFYQLEASYFTILKWFLSYIDMNQPWIYMCSPSRSSLPPPSLPDPSGSSQCIRPKHLSHASNLGWLQPR